jgi:hypothetical protein
LQSSLGRNSRAGRAPRGSSSGGLQSFDRGTSAYGGSSGSWGPSSRRRIGCAETRPCCSYWVDLTSRDRSKDQVCSSPFSRALIGGNPKLLGSGPPPPYAYKRHASQGSPWLTELQKTGPISRGVDSGGNPPPPRRATGATSAAASRAPAICTESSPFTVNHEDDSTSMSSRRSSRPSPDPGAMTSSSSKIKGTSRKLSQPLVRTRLVEEP